MKTKELYTFIISFLLILLLTSCGDNSSDEGGAAPPDYDNFPTFTVSPGSGTILSKIISLNISFSEEVKGANNADNYSLSGKGVGTLSVDSVTPGINNEYKVNFSGNIANGPIVITVHNISNEKEYPLAGNTIYFSGDTGNPVMETLPVSGTVCNKLDQVRITFSKPVTGADVSANYTIKGPLTISSIGKVDERTYLLGFSGTPANGEISIQLNNIADSDGNPLNGNTIQYSMDIDGPDISTSPAADTTFSSISVLDIKYSEPVTGAVETSNYSFTGTGKGNLAVTSIEQFDNNIYRLTLAGTPVHGDLTLHLNNIFDLAGNEISVGTIDFISDQNGPGMSADIVNFATINSLNEIEITYTEPVLKGTLLSNYTVHGSGAGSLEASDVTHISGNKYQIKFQGDPGNGPFTIEINGVTDKTGNALNNNSIALNADTTGPEIASSSPSSGEKSIVINSSISVTFNEEIKASTIDNSSFLVNGGIDGTITINEKTITFFPTNKLNPGIEYTVTLKDSIQDKYGNSLSANQNFTFNTLNTRQYGTDSFDEIMAIKGDNHGNLYAVGLTSGDFDGNSTAGGSDVVVIKINYNGQKEWVATWGNKYDDKANDVAIDSNQNIYVCGFTKPYSSSSNSLLIKYDKKGNELWHKIIENTAFSMGVAVDSNDYIYITGNVYDSGSSCYISKYDTFGELQWQKINDGKYSSNPQKISIDQNDNLYIAGISQTYSYSKFQSYVLKYNNNGDFKAGHHISTSWHNWNNGITIGPDGNVYTTGTASYSAIPGNSLYGQFDIYLAKYDNDLNLLWARQYGTSKDDEGLGITVNQDGDIFIAASTDGALGQKNGGYDMAVLKYSANGTRLWSKQFGTSATDIPNSITMHNNSLYLGGYTRQSMDHNTYNGETDIIMFQLNTDGEKE